MPVVSHCRAGSYNAARFEPWTAQGVGARTITGARKWRPARRATRIILEVDEFNVEESDIVNCPECGASLVVDGLSPLEFETADDEDEDDDDEDEEEEDEEDGDDEDDLDEDDEEEEREDWEA